MSNSRRIINIYVEVCRMQSKFFWCDIDSVIPNPKNPRKDPGVKTNEIQSIIQSKGWEEGITAYKRGIFYVIISGHRRWYAAKAMGIKEVPIFLVEAPKDEKEELERLGSIQGGQVDWTPYEWAEYTYNMYKMLNEPSYTSLAAKFGVTHNIVAARIRVYQYYTRTEIETKLENGMYSISMLNYLRGWLERLQQYQPDLVDAMGKDMIRQSMLRKLENKCFNSEIFYDQFVVKANMKQMLAFITDSNKKLSTALKEIQETTGEIRIKNAKHNTRKIRMAEKQINALNYRTRKEAEDLSQALETLEKEIKQKRKILLQQIKSEEIHSN